MALDAAIAALNAQTLGEKYSLLFPAGSAASRPGDKEADKGLDNRIAFYIGRNCVKSPHDVRQLGDITDPLKRSVVYGYAAVYAPVVCARLSIEDLLSLKAPLMGSVCAYLVKEAVEKRPWRELRELRSPMLKAACAVELRSPGLHELYEGLYPLAAEGSFDIRPVAEMPDSDGKAAVLALVGVHAHPQAALRALGMLSRMQDSPSRHQSLARVLAHLVRQSGVVSRSYRTLRAAIKSLPPGDARAMLLVDAHSTASARQKVNAVWEVMAILALLAGLAGAVVWFVYIVASPGRGDPYATAVSGRSARYAAIERVAIVQTILLLAIALGVPWFGANLMRLVVGRPARDSFRDAALDETSNYASLRSDDARSRLLRFVVSQRGGRKRAFDVIRLLPPKEKVKAAGFAFDESDEYYRLLVDSARIEHPGPL